MAAQPATAATAGSVAVCLALGSNLGDRHATIMRAVEALCREVGPIVAATPVVQTEPWGYESTHAYLNAITLHLTRLSPARLLAVTQAIEHSLGRTAKTPAAGSAAAGIDAAGSSAGPLPPYADRPIDIDILLYGHLHMATPELTIPHPRITERPFVSGPLRELLARNTGIDICRAP